MAATTSVDIACVANDRVAYGSHLRTHDVICRLFDFPGFRGCASTWHLAHA